jgi:hypothetical protein
MRNHRVRCLLLHLAVRGCGGENGEWRKGGVRMSCLDLYCWGIVSWCNKAIGSGVLTLFPLAQLLAILRSPAPPSYATVRSIMSLVK